MEGEKCRPLDHMRPIPFIHPAPFTSPIKINFYIYRNIFQFFLPNGIYIVCWHSVHLNLRMRSFRIENQIHRYEKHFRTLRKSSSISFFVSKERKKKTLDNSVVIRKALIGSSCQRQNLGYRSLMMSLLLHSIISI